MVSDFNVRFVEFLGPIYWSELANDEICNVLLVILALRFHIMQAGFSFLVRVVLATQARKRQIFLSCHARD